MGKIWIHLLLLLTLLYLAVIYQSSGLLWLCGIGVLIQPFFMYILYCNTKKLIVRLAIPKSALEQQKSGRIGIQLDNAGKFPIPKIKAVLRLTNSRTRKKCRLRLRGGISAGEQAVLSGEVTDLDFGLWQVSCVRLFVYDSFGWFSRKKKCRQQESFMVLPGSYDTNINIGIRTRLFSDEGEEYDPHQKGEDPAEIFNLRDYQSGDRFNQIHWKLSAKNDTLIIQEMSRPVGCNVVVFLNGEPDRMKEWQKNFWETIATISSGLLEQKCCHYLAWYDGDTMEVMRKSIRREEDLYEFWGELSGTRIKSCGSKKEYAGRFRGESYASWIELDENLDLYCNEAYTANLKGAGLKEKLQEMELTL